MGPGTWSAFVPLCGEQHNQLLLQVTSQDLALVMGISPGPSSLIE